MTTDRTTYIKSLRALADLLDAHPDLPLPSNMSPVRNEVGWYVHTLRDALSVQAVMSHPETTRTNSAAFPVDITGSIAGMFATVSVVASAALAPGESVTLPALNPLLGADVAVAS